jgi:nucleotide-binding universal stress UspA family protein
VILGSHGHGRLVSSLLGSVAGDVHLHLAVPLLVVHAIRGDN